MQRALTLAKKGEGWTLPNPMVGAVIVKDGKIIGEGFHKQFGGDHAEVEALKGIDAKGATLYVTLEPCSHTGKTPPCSQAIIESGIRKVIIASEDPLRSGIQDLEEAGVHVEVGLLNEEAKALNKFFFTFHEKKRPFITLKVATSSDWKIAENKETQTWLTGKEASIQTHKLRHQHQAILVGSGTVLTDNPHLGVREFEGKDPTRIILKGSREIPEDFHIFRDKNFLVLEKMKVEDVMQKLYEKNISSVLVEGGHEVFSSFLNAGLVDNMEIFIAPTLLGKNSLTMADLDEKLSLSFNSVRQLGQDLWINATPQWVSSNG